MHFNIRMSNKQVFHVNCSEILPSAKGKTIAELLSGERRGFTWGSNINLFFFVDSLIFYFVFLC